MGYIAEMYGKRSPDFVHGFLAALDTYAIWRDGIQIIGCLEESLEDVRKNAIKELAEHPEDF
jgi:uncharacterized protein YbjQ (UPF0145 family)